MSKKDRILIFLTLIILMLTGFFVRVNNFEKSRQRTIDEMAYFSLGLHLSRDVTQYNTQRFVQVYREDFPERDLPDYFSQPIFKHPPLFSFLLAASIKLFGSQGASAVYPSALFGSLMIVLTYLLGKMCFDESVGLLAAFLLWMDPIHMICSQKIWPDTTVSFFMLFALLLYQYGFKYGHHRYFLFAGVVTGLAVLTKYSGILIIFIVFIFSLGYKQECLKNRNFFLSLLIPLAMVLPWFYWNYTVYGFEFFLNQIQVHNIVLQGRREILLLGVLIIGIMLLAIKFFLLRQESVVSENMIKEEPEPEEAKSLVSIRKFFILVLGLLFLYILSDNIFNSFRWKHFPVTTWSSGYFRDPLFYFGRLIEFNLLYTLAFLSFFVANDERIEKGALLYIAVGLTFIFFIVWQAYQSRYILLAISLLLILAVRLAQEIWWAFESSEYRWLRILGRILIIITAVFVFLKTNYINYLVSYPNDMAYF